MAWLALIASEEERPRLATALRTTHSSAVASPETRLSPRPRTALMTTSDRSPVTGLAVKATPAASAGTMR